MKLISTTDYIMQIKPADVENQKELNDKYKSIYSYAAFLIKPLELGYFVPCDLDGNVLENPLQMDYGIGQPKGYEYEARHPIECYEGDFKQYKEAEERVLFKGNFRVDGNKLFLNDDYYLDIHTLSDNTIEELTYFKGVDLELTETAIKQIGL